VSGAVVGVALFFSVLPPRRVLLGAAEHHCVLHTRALLERMGFVVQEIPVDARARIDLDALAAMLGPDVLLVSVMHANNEVGTIQPARSVADLAHGAGALYHCDAVQTFLVPLNGRPWRVADLDADLVSVSGHKVHGPKGVGALYVRAGVKPFPLLAGGGQEREMRAGTENVAGIVGFAAAVDAVREDEGGVGRQRDARDAFIEEVSPLEGLTVTVPDARDLLPGHAHVRIEGVDAESMLILLDRMGVSASSGAACSSGSLEPSHVLEAMGLGPEESKRGLRFTFGRTSALDEAREAARRVCEAAAHLRSSRT
jgi:cysteine desulfurase